MQARIRNNNNTITGVLQNLFLYYNPLYRHHDKNYEHGDNTFFAIT